ncbi:MAG: carbon-monoxide dehydrogenase large subunit [Chloroflexi bacterium]|jgi:CO/xanthine dehydrogenase Mo-binding subunit|nr:MAG: carbon-monoxide dehydrogenase large subunit [Chloroflexota bacterium]
MPERRVVGKPVAHHEGPDKVRGRTQYTADFFLPNMLWGKTLRSPLPHARILRVDTSRAQALDGVHTVISGADLPPYRFGRYLRDMPVLAWDTVRFVGERVAAVAADDPDIADEALSLIDVQYEELPAVFDPLEASQEGAPVLHEGMVYDGAYTHPEAPLLNNLCAYGKWGRGDVEAEFAKADRIFEHTFRTPMGHQGYIEPHACLVSVDASGHTDIWASNKSPWTLRQHMAATLDLPPDNFTVHPVSIGGDFGGKGQALDPLIAYLLSQRSGRPVKMVLSYAEELLAMNPRHPSIVTVKTGVTNDGRLCAQHTQVTFNNGAYGAFKSVPYLNMPGVRRAASCYRIPATSIESSIIYTNTVPGGFMRAPGGPQVAFAVEVQFDIIAKALGMDPAAFRMQNLLTEGETSTLGSRWEHFDGKETLAKALDVVGWNTPKKGAFVGRGMAMHERSGGPGTASVKLLLDGTGHVSVHTGVYDAGQGALTALRQIAAEALALRLDDVSVHPVAMDGEFSQDDGLGATRTTHVAGNAVLQAAKQLRSRLLRAMVGRMGVSEDILTWDGANVVGPGRTVSFKEAASRAVEANGGLIVEAVTLQSKEAEHTSFTAQVAEVKVDPDTGHVQVRKLVTVHEVGTVINELAHQGQVEGGIVQGLGFGTMEEMPVEEGRPTTLHMGDFKVPNIADVPELETVLLKRSGGSAPYQARVIGEVSNVPLGAAIANAVYDAIGVPLFELPATAERVYRLLQEFDKA